MVGSRSEQQLVELLAPLRSLAALLPEAADIESEHARACASQLHEFEVEAIQKFIKAGQRCLATLTGTTLVELQRVQSGTRAVARGRRDREDIEGETAASIYEVFEMFDADKDGVLSACEFKNAFQKLTAQEIKDQELGIILKAVDVDRSNDIDIHEFCVWLYGQDGKIQKRATDAKKTTKVELDTESNKLREELEAVRAELNMKTRTLNQMEAAHDDEIEASLNFWRGIAQNAVLTIDRKLDLRSAEWLGNGKYGFILKAKRQHSDQSVVVKMMGLRWAHVAVKEWQTGSLVGKHPNIVDYDDVMLHNDDDMSIEQLLKEGYKSGKLVSKVKRTEFPDRYLCLSQEFMNLGTVQNWMDGECLCVGGMCTVISSVCNALAFMHKQKVTHNDIKPENIMLHQQDHKLDAPVIVKLGDLGCARKGTDRSADYWQLGMTIFCMASGERFGTRKYHPEKADVFCNELAALCEKADAPKRDQMALVNTPPLIRKLFTQDVDLSDIPALRWLQDWSFFGSLSTGSISSLISRLPGACIDKFTQKVDDD
eukprot:TRINITY_DN60574_c0_g1_i1.p1 TRINITY_DN60574_c0_g1~~TRINITY_DN60574_c0_g1_i1.p1  ORF type:complete len:542 (+),score=111.13 TRINITY_DN60574_c0_g1_i1:122-1747(+)